MAWQIKKISVVYNGVMKPVGKMLPVDTPFILDKINILYVGRFDYQKGFDILLGLNDCLDKDRFMITAVGDFVNNVPYDISNNQINFTGWLPQEKTALLLSSRRCACYAEPLGIVWTGRSRGAELRTACYCQ
ncbi:glycosyltransferase [Pantoea ananatis]